MYIQVKYKDGTFYGKDNATGQWIVIEQSISFIYVKTTLENNQQNFSAVTFERHTDILTLLRDYLTGVIRDDDNRLQDVYFRTGWYDKRFNALQMMPLADLLKRFRYSKNISKFERRRVTAICKQLSVSMRDVYRASLVDPIAVLEGRIKEI